MTPPAATIAVKRALVSVSDKSGLVPFATRLVERRGGDRVVGRHGGERSPAPGSR